MTDSPKWRSEQDEERNRLGMWRLLRGERQMAGLITVDGMVHPRGLKQLVDLLNEQAEQIERLECECERTSSILKWSVATNAQMRERLTAEVDRLRAQHSRAHSRVLDALGVKPHD